MGVAPVADLVEREVARRLKKQRPRTDHRAPGVRPQHAGEGLLHNVVEIGQRGKPRPQPSAQQCLMRVHFSGEPGGVIGTGRIHSETNAGTDRRIQVRFRAERKSQLVGGIDKQA